MAPAVSMGELRPGSSLDRVVGSVASLCGCLHTQGAWGQGWGGVGTSLLGGPHLPWFLSAEPGSEALGLTGLRGVGRGQVSSVPEGQSGQPGTRSASQGSPVSP